jgi:hypothetical protein
MDIHPWTKYEIARIRDEERLLRARSAMQARELRPIDEGDAEVGVAAGSWLDRLRKRAPVVDRSSLGVRSG